MVINEVKEVLSEGRIVESAFQITVEGEYIDQSYFMLRLLPSNEVLVQLPSVSNTFLDNNCYQQICSGWNVLHAGDAWQSHFATSQDVMRSAFTASGNEHLKVRVIILSFPDDYKVSNELFSAATFRGFDPRTKVYLYPCTVQYVHENTVAKHEFFRLAWRYNKSMDNPRTTNVGPSHIDTAFNALNKAFGRKNY